MNPPEFHIPRKRFGQNFLCDQQIIQQILDVVQPKSDDVMVEIGPGLGALTYPLLKKVSHLTVIELDRSLAEKLAQHQEKTKGLHIYQMDALKFDFTKLKPSSLKLRIIGNLPYNISTPLIFHLLNYAEWIEDMHFMLQKEVVQRIVALPNSKAYGRLSVMVQYHCQAKLLFEVPPEAFKPKPRVTSAILRLSPYTQKPYPKTNIPVLQKIVSNAFNQRRKTIQNSLKSFLKPQDFIHLNIDPSKRAEALSIYDFVEISRFLCREF